MVVWMAEALLGNTVKSKLKIIKKEHHGTKTN